MLPKEITIGCYDYEVIQTEEPILINDHKCSGSIDYLNHTIKISSEQCFSEQSKEQTLWHEIVHGLINYRSVEYGEVDEETFVEELAMGLYLLCKSNWLLPGQKIPQGAGGVVNNPIFKCRLTEKDTLQKLQDEIAKFQQI